MTKDFLSLFDITREDLDLLFELTDNLKSGNSGRPLEGKTVAMIFQKPSLRTRVSFEVGVMQLGGHITFLSQESIGVGTREAARDVARLLSRYCDAIVARMNDHTVLADLARSASIPVINALTDKSHPCQVLADAYTIRERGRLKPGIKVAFVGDGNNVVHSWLEFATLYPIHFALAAPQGYWPDESVVRRAQSSGVSSIEIVQDPVEAVRNAGVVYTDVWTSMGQESETAKRKKAFAGYQVNEELLAKARPDCLVMHCLPAHRGEEITDGVMEGPNSVVFDEAENRRLHVQKAVLVELFSSRSNGVKSSVSEDSTVA
ncbi:MAG: ornithine carbamoyltransferase [Ignavibacteriales bacterium]|nr:ornithine carbamoyltransferase [Ignavibacteriales bacterium]